VRHGVPYFAIRANLTEVSVERLERFVSRFSPPPTNNNFANADAPTIDPMFPPALIRQESTFRPTPFSHADPSETDADSSENLRLLAKQRQDSLHEKIHLFESQTSTSNLACSTSPKPSPAIWGGPRIRRRPLITPAKNPIAPSGHPIAPTTKFPRTRRIGFVHRNARVRPNRFVRKTRPLLLAPSNAKRPKSTVSRATQGPPRISRHILVLAHACVAALLLRSPFLRTPGMILRSGRLA